MEQLIEVLVSDKHAPLAAWLQAGGAMLAVVAAFLVSHLQARYAQKQEDRRAAERVRALARLFRLLAAACKRSGTLRQHGGSAMKDSLRSNYDEFNFIADEINRFRLVDAPSENVMRAIMRYRKMCGLLSNETNPDGNALANADEVPKNIAELLTSADELLTEADRLARKGPRAPLTRHQAKS